MKGLIIPFVCIFLFYFCENVKSKENFIVKDIESDVDSLLYDAHKSHLVSLKDDQQISPNYRKYNAE